MTLPIERIQEIAERTVDLFMTDDTINSTEAHAHIIATAIQTALAESERWIPVGDNPPKGEAIFYHPATKPNRNGQAGLSAWVRPGRFHDTPNRPATHWKPLPPAPTPEGE